MMKRKNIELKDTGAGLMLSAGTWKHPLSHDEGKQLKETLRRLLNQPVGYDVFDVLLTEDGGTESITIGRKDAFNVYIELKRVFNN